MEQSNEYKCLQSPESRPLELQLHAMWSGDLNLGPLKEQHTLLTTESFL